MAEPLTLTATAIVGFVFTKIAETLTAKATEAVLPKINELRQKIWNKLRGNPQANIEITKAEQGAEADLDLIADYLKVAMREDTHFAQEVQDLANEINKELEDEGQGKNIMNVYGGKAYQQNHNKGTINNAEKIINYHPNP